MKFSKDERKIDPKSKNKPNLGFNYDSEDDEEQSRNSQCQAPLNYGQASTSGFERKSLPKDPIKLADQLHLQATQTPAIVARPVVLDKFGNFRLADPGLLPVKSADSTTAGRRSRSRSHRRYSRSRSDSR